MFKSVAKRIAQNNGIEIKKKRKLAKTTIPKGVFDTFKKKVM